MRLVLWLRNGLLGLSLLICLIAAVRWLRSYRNVEVFTFGDQTLYRLISGGGAICLESMELVIWNPGSSRPARARGPTPNGYSDWRKQVQGAPERWESRPFKNVRQISGRAWGFEMNPLLPRAGFVRHTYRQTYWVGGGTEIVYFVGSGISVPYWFLLVLTGFLPAVRMATWRRQRRRLRLNLCPICGFDLRASKERCPECGTAIELKTPRSSPAALL